VCSSDLVDSAPVLEKPLAQRAGLGWQGRNTCLISPKVGSFFFIVGIFVDISLEPVPAFTQDYCGTCRKCMDACPTGCILPDRTIDARRCISYLSIEHRGSIPYELRPLMGNMIFGCDVCQNVCPWNGKADNSNVLQEFLPVNNWNVSPELLNLLSLQPFEFNQVYRLSPIRRAKRVGLLRNAAIALGNSLAPEAVQALRSVIETEQGPFIRSHAAWALGRINTTKAREFLSNYLKNETDETAILEIKRILAA
jgi:epoxyqueuosine reductase